MPENQSPAEKYPHVAPEQIEIVESYGNLLNNTGGNDPLDLLNDYRRPNSNIAVTNIFRFTMAVAVSSQIQLLIDLQKLDLITPEGKRSEA